MILGNGECHWKGCDTWSYIGQDKVECNQCTNGWGKQTDMTHPLSFGRCYPCKVGNQMWNDCEDCSIDSTNLVADTCTSCNNGKVLISNGPTNKPNDICSFTVLDRCLNMNPTDPNVCD